MQEEIWKDIPGYGGHYQVSNFGNVKSLDRIQNMCNGGKRYAPGRILKGYNHNGYITVHLSKNGIIKNYSVHVLVAMSFLNHDPCGFKLVVDHVNGCKSDNNVNNLQIVSHRENISKSTKNKKRSSKYIGVYWRKLYKKWYASIRIGSKSKHLGTFENEYDAHLAYQKALKELVT